MNKLISVYQEKLELKNAGFSLIEHEDATVAQVYKVTKSDRQSAILKVCTRVNDFFHELYFLNFFAHKIPVPRVIKAIEPQEQLYGAILMEYLQGSLIKEENFTESLAYQVGSLLGKIHSNKVSGYGDLTKPDSLSPDAKAYFTMKFNEGILECRGHLPEKLINNCLEYYQTHSSLLDSVDGPCIIHRDFRAGNVLQNNEKVAGVIDWSSARASFAEEDFCFLEHGDWPTNALTKKAFLEGYATIRPVPDYTAIMPLLRMSRAIAFIGFTVKRNTWDTKMAYKYKFNRHYIENLLV